MRKYELMVVMKKDFPHEDEKKRKELITQLLTEQTVTKLEVADFGKRQLAYEIRHEAEGCYLLATFEAETINVSRIEQEVRLLDNVLRHLLTKVEETK